MTHPRRRPVSRLRRAALLGAMLLPLPALAQTKHPQPEQIIAYLFPQETTLDPGTVAVDKLTRINFAFANVKDGQVVEGHPADAANYAILRQLRAQKNPALELLVSVGGWSWSGGFSDAALTPASRARFIESAVQFLRKYQLDGLDIDWEYPGMTGNNNKHRPEDGAHFTALLHELRVRFDQEEATTHHHWLLSIAAATSDEYLANVQLGPVAASLDTVNLMVYDIYEPENGHLTGNHAPLHTDPADPKHASVDVAVQKVLAAGVPPSKLVLGVPFYGHVWANVSPKDHGLFQPGTAAPTAYAGYTAIQQNYLGHGFVRYWDAAAAAPSLYSPAKRQFVSYDDPESLRLKARFILEHHLAGVMFWEYSNDPSLTLLNTLHAALRGTSAAH